MNLIGISGRIGSGKDTVGKIIQYLTYNNNRRNKHFSTVALSEFGRDYGIHNRSDWQIKKFADKLKDIVCLLIGCAREQLEDAEFKNKELGEEWKQIIYNDSMYPNMQILTPRLLLQLLGTECGRNIIHPNIWINATMADYRCTTLADGNSSKDKYPNWLITDLRFPNELEAIKKRGGINIRVHRDIHKGNAHIGVIPHESEIALDNAGFDYVIDNNGTIEELLESVRTMLIHYKIIE